MSASTFNAVYLALVALAWERLEELQLLLMREPGHFVDAAQQRVLHLKLELLHVSESSALHSGTRQLSILQNLVIQRFAGRLLLALDGAYLESVEALAGRINEAQDFLCDEACGLESAPAVALESRRYSDTGHFAASALAF